MVALSSICVFAFVRPADRNYELLLVYLIGLVFTVTLFGIFPTLGPASLIGQPALQQQILEQLRARQLTNLSYDGIVSFPSYHTLMAIAVIYTHRGIRLTFWPMLLWNGGMLITVPFGGDHYATDMVGGAAIAALSIALARAVANAGSLFEVSTRLQPNHTIKFKAV